MLQIVLDAKPKVLNHNTETVPRLYRAVRSGARYERTLRLLENVKKFSPGMVRKTGVMVGIGETTEELLEVFRDLAERKSGHPDHRAIFASLERPSADDALLHARRIPMLKDEAMKMGFRHVESGALVRSSYHAHEQAESVTR